MPSGRGHYRITWGDAVSAHTRALETGGLDGISNRGLVLAAIGRPYTGYYRSLAKKTAALVQSMAHNHGFIDGNKRTTLLLVNLLIERSGYTLRARPREDLVKALEDMIVEVAKGELTLEQIVEWFDVRLRRRP